MKRNAKYFGQSVADELEFKGLTQVELSKRSGVTQAAISEIVSGKRRPTLDTAVKIANALSMTLDSMVQS